MGRSRAEVGGDRRRRPPHARRGDRGGARRPARVAGYSVAPAARFAALARRDLCRAAARLWSIPLEAALSYAREASLTAALAASASPIATAVLARLVAVFSEERTPWLRLRCFSFCRFRLIWDLMLAMERRVYQRPQARPRVSSSAAPVR